MTLNYHLNRFKETLRTLAYLFWVYIGNCWEKKISAEIGRKVIEKFKENSKIENTQELIWKNSSKTMDQKNLVCKKLLESQWKSLFEPDYDCFKVLRWPWITNAW